MSGRNTINRALGAIPTGDPETSNLPPIKSTVYEGLSRHRSALLRGFGSVVPLFYLRREAVGQHYRADPAIVAARSAFDAVSSALPPEADAPGVIVDGRY